jgi:K+-dependent Na+/Ca+ exchanger-like protein
MLIFFTILLLLSFYLLYLVTEYVFIPSLDRMGERLGMTSDITGSTLMAAGSSVPELAVMIFSLVIRGHHEAIGVGTIVGSALFNLFVITGVVMVIRRKARLAWQPMVRDLLFYLVTVAILFLVFHNGDVSFREALLMIGGYLFYLLTFRLWKRFYPYEETEPPPEAEVPKDGFSGRILSFFRRLFGIRNMYLLFFISILMISFLAWLLVHSVIRISEILQIKEFHIAVVILAVGTSVPDLVSSAIVARQGRAGMAINNAVGSNIFDVLIGLGLPLFLYHLFTDNKIFIASGDLKLSLLFLSGSVILLFLIFLFTRWRTRRSAGILLILLYLTFLVLEVSGYVNL